MARIVSKMVLTPSATAALTMAMIVSTGCVAQTQPQADAASAASAGDTSYRLGVGDRVRISTFNEPSLSGDFPVGGNGSISFPLIGDVPVQGKSAKELQEALATRLGSGYLLNPRITVEVLNFRPFFILGEVGQPGRYPTFEGLTVKSAIATAGGFTYRANQKTARIQRYGESKERKVRIDDNTLIAPGDVLRIGERYF